MNPEQPKINPVLQRAPLGARTGETLYRGSIIVLGLDIIYAIGRYGDAFFIDIFQDPVARSVLAASAVTASVGYLLRQRFTDRLVENNPNLNPNEVGIPTLLSDSDIVTIPSPPSDTPKD